MKYPNKLADARAKAGLTQQQVAEAINMTVTGYQNYEWGKRDMRSSTIRALSEVLNVPANYLLGIDTIEARPCETIQVPVLGRIAAGTPRSTYSQADEYHDTPTTTVSGHSRAFWLVVAGNSMNRIFPEGSLVLIDPDATVNNGDIAAVFVNGDDATLKRVYYEGDSVRLHPESYDVEYRDRVIDKTDPEAPEVHMVGKAVSYTAPDGWRG